MGLHVGAWNIEKQNGADTDANFVLARMRLIFQLREIDVFFFEELAHRQAEGVRLLQIICEELNAITFDVAANRRVANFHYYYQPGTDDRGYTINCNIGLIYNSNAFNPRFPVRVNYLWDPDNTRPVAILSHQDLSIGGIHAKSGRVEVAGNEIGIACAELAERRGRALLIGDMNIDFDDRSEDANDPLRIGWRKYAASPAQTYRNVRLAVGARLDYCWAQTDLGITAAGLQPYNDPQFRRVDHAPILYNCAGIPAPGR